MKTRLRMVAALAVIVVAGLSTIATSQPVPAASDEVEFDVGLGPDQPVIARLVTVKLQHGDNRPVNSSLAVFELSEVVDESLWISLVPVDPAEPADPSYGYEGWYVEQEITTYCQSGCERSYVVVTRLQDPADSVLASLGVRLTASYEGQGGMSPPPGATVELDLDADQVAFASSPALRVKQSGVLEVGENVAQPGELANTQTWTGELVISAEALSTASQLGYPMVGRIAALGTFVPTGDFPVASATLTVGDLSSVFGTPQLDVDWLQLCSPGEECRLPVTLDLTWQSDEPYETPPRTPQKVRYEFKVQAELAFLDDAVPPEGAQLTLQPY